MIKDQHKQLLHLLNTDITINKVIWLTRFKISTEVTKHLLTTEAEKSSHLETSLLLFVSMFYVFI